MLFFGLGVVWVSGINLYVVILVIGLMGVIGLFDFLFGFEVFVNFFVIFVVGVMYFVEFFVDKIFGVDMGWDVIYIFICIFVGVMFVVGVMGDLVLGVEIVVVLLGGGLVVMIYVIKVGFRVLMNILLEFVINWIVLVVEDVVVFGGVWVVFYYFWIFFGFFVLFFIVVVWLLLKIWWGIKWVVCKI